MPYIKQGDREDVKEAIHHMVKVLISKGYSKGVLNYVITSLVHHYIKSKGISYSNLSDITGILNDVKVEFERSIVAKYEDRKMSENGNIGVLDV